MTMAAKKKTNQSGQALIELIIFLPLIFAIYSMISGFAGAINGSINQQKFTRSYFYFRVQHNSTLPKPDEARVFQSWGKFGMYMIGWKELFRSNEPYMPCYRISRAVPSNETNCGPYSNENTQLIRVGTVYGMCGTTYGRNNNDTSYFPLPDNRDSDFKEVLDVASCLIQ